MVVLASGDPLWFGLGRILCDRIGAERLRFHPAPTSLQLAFARIGRPWQDAEWVSLHGRDPEILASTLQKRPAALAVLTDPNQGGAGTVQQMLRSSGLEASTDLWLCENLGHPDERVQLIAPHAALPTDLHPLLIALLIAREPAAPDPHQLPLFGLDDGLYLQHSDHPGLMTKREVRIQLLAELALPQQGVLWDLGAGTGSVGLEALRLRPGLQLLAVERRAGGAQLIQRNAQRLGVSPAAVLEADATTVLNGGLPDGLSQPDRVLLGGGGAQRERLLQERADAAAAWWCCGDSPGEHRGLGQRSAAARERWIGRARAATAGLAGTTAGGWHPPGSDEPHVDRDGNEAGLSRLHGESWSGVIRTGSPMPMPSRCASPAPISITASTKSARPLPSASAA